MKKILKKNRYLIIAIAFCLPVLISVAIMANKREGLIRNNASAIPYTVPNDVNYVYLTDLWDTDKMITKVSSWKDVRALKINQNEPGDLISLKVNGNQKYFINGLFAHAESTLVFNITDFIANGFDTFTAYLGVDTYAASNGNGVQFTIYGSEDGKTYTKLLETSTFKGSSEAKEVKLRIKDYNYLMLFADDINGNNSSDHAVYANAMLYNSEKYSPKTETEVSWIKDLDTYDAELKQYTAEQILQNEDLELKLLQRTLVNRVGYQIMQAYATSDDEEKVETLNWLFNNYKYLKAYITGGEPLGNYVNSFDILSDLYHEYGQDLTSDNYDDTQKETFLKMMMSISLTHSGTVALWTTGENGAIVKANPVKRYEVYKNLYLNENLPEEYEQTFRKDIFESLTIEEMRWVVDARLSDEEIPWLNWFSGNLENTKYKGRNGMDPYTYIWYDDSFDWRYTDPKYYEEDSNYCGMDIKSKFTQGYQRGLNCDKEYSLKKWGVDSNTPTKPRLWIIWEEDGVCGAISKTGENLNNSYGMVAAVTRQPAHAAYLVQNKTKNEDGTFTTTWGIGNDVGGWANSSGTEKGERLPLNWGSTTNKYATYFNGSYVILAQSAFDDFENYIKSLEYTFIADMYEEDVKKQRSYYRDIVGEANINDNKKNVNAIQTFNLDGWYGLIQTYLNDVSLTSEDYYKLSYEIMANLEEYPLAMNDMLNLIMDKLEGSHKLVVSNSYKNLLTKLSEVKNDSTEYRQGQAVRQVAQSLLGKQEETVSFSFDGENANKIVLATPQPFEYSLNYSYNASTKEVIADWTQVTEGNIADLSARLDEINVDNDIVIHILGDGDKTLTSKSVMVIDIEKGSAPSKLYPNDLENKVIGTTDSMEWKIEESTKGWTKFASSMPDLSGTKTVFVRDGAHGHFLPSDEVEFTFENDSNDRTKKYVSISRLKVKASSANSKSEAAENVIDGNANTFWHNAWSKADMARWIEIEVTDEEPIELSKIEYVPRQDTGSNGRFLKAKLEVSLDGESWTTITEDIEWANDKTTKTYILEKPTLAKYIRLTALSSAGDFASAAMINIFESTANRISVSELTVTYMTSGFKYDGNPKTPEVYVKHIDEPLVLNEDYTIEYENNVKVGTAQIILTGMGAYRGSKIFEFDIEKADHPSIIPDKEIVVGKDITHLIYAAEYLPEGWFWSMEDYDKELIPGQKIEVSASYFGEDYECYENVNAKITVIRENGSKPVIKLSGDAKLTFNIDNEENVGYDYFKNLLSVTDEEDDQEGKALELVLNSSLTDWDGKVWDRIGTYHVGYSVTDSHGNTTDYVISFTLYSEENPQLEINNEKYTFHVDEVYYTGNALTPHVVVKDETGHILTVNTDYELSNYTNNTNAGVANVNVKGIRLYKGDVTPSFEIKKATKPEVIPSDKISVSSTTQSLADIELPMGWNWANAGASLKDGANELKIIYAGDANHEAYEMMITVVKDTTQREQKDVVEKENNPVEPEIQNPDNNNNKENDVTPKPAPDENPIVEPNVDSNVNNQTEQKDSMNVVSPSSGSKDNNKNNDEDNKEKTDTNEKKVDNPTEDDENKLLDSKSSTNTNTKIEEKNLILLIVPIASLIVVVAFALILYKIKD